VTVLVRRLDRVAALLSDASGVVAAVAVLGMLGHICLEILLRAVFGTSTFVLDEFVGYMVAALIFLGLAPTFRAHGHLRIGLLLDLAGPAIRRFAEAAALVALTLLASFLAYYFAQAGLRFRRGGTVSQTIAEVPLWIPVGVAALGWANLGLQALSRLLMLATGQVSVEELEGVPLDG